MHQEINIMPKQIFQRPPKVRQNSWSGKSDKGAKGPPVRQPVQKVKPAKKQEPDSKTQSE